MTTATTGDKKCGARLSFTPGMFPMAVLVINLIIFCGSAVAGAVRESLLEMIPSSPSLPGGCVGPYCKLYGQLRLHHKPYCAPRPPPPSRLPRPPSRPAAPSPPPNAPDLQPASLTTYCGAWRTISAGDTCASIVRLFGLPSTDFLQRINPTLNCAAPQVGLNLCVNKFSQWALPNCQRFVSLWDGDSCSSVVNANLATLPYGLDDLMYCNVGLNCNYLLRGMLTCVYCV